MRERKIRRFLRKPAEMKEDTQMLIEAARSGARKAIRSSRALGLTIKYIADGQIVEKSPSGEIKVIRKIESATLDFKDKSALKKGAVLCRR